MLELNQQWEPKGDQQQAIDKLVKSIRAGNRFQTLLGVTGSGKTFTMANIMAQIGRPVLIMCHNKTLAAQLYSEFKNFFPKHAVEYFVSYFDYYQPEAYIPRTDTFIEKDSNINEEIERLRLSSMSSLISRPDVIVIASVSCIYGLGSPDDYENMMLPLSVGQKLDRDVMMRMLVDMMYERNDIELKRGCFRVRGDIVDVIPAYLDNQAIRIEFFGDEIEQIKGIEPLTGSTTAKLDRYTLFPAKQFVTPADKLRRAIVNIREEMEQRVIEFEKQNKLLEAQRIRMRTQYDIEMMQELGFCQGIENYSRHLAFREVGSKPGTLLDFFPEPPLVLIDESHVTVPQISGMYEGDRSRKTVLVEHGFRLPSALDNRPLKFHEFMSSVGQLLFVSATPGRFELENSYVGNDQMTGLAEVKEKKAAQTLRTVTLSGNGQKVEAFEAHKKGCSLVVEQVIRPTGLLDPVIYIKPLAGQIDTTIEWCHGRVERGEKVLVTTLTKRTAEDLTDYLREAGFKVCYLHSDIDAIERVAILASLRKGECDILVGINLLREGLDLPEVTLVCILDADKEGFLRSETSLIQTAGRAARNTRGEVLLFADVKTRSIQVLLEETERRRQIQLEHNQKYGIVPTTVIRADQELLQYQDQMHHTNQSARVAEELGGKVDVVEVIRQMQEEMLESAQKLDFERAALLRDQIKQLELGTEIKREKINPIKYKVKRKKK